LKIPAKIWNNRKVKNQYEGQLILHVLKDEGIMLGFSSGTSVATVVTTGFLPIEQTGDNMRKSCSLIIYVCYRVVLLVEHELDGEQQEVQQHEEQLNEVTRKLILREDELFSQDCHSEEEEDQLQKDYESLSIQIWMAVHNTFTPSSLNDKHLEVLRNAVDSIQQQEMQDQRWRDCSKDKVPAWRPQRWLSTHNKLLQKMVESRLTEATEDDSDEAKQLSSAVKKQDKVKQWLNTVLKKEEESWLSGKTPELIDSYFYSPLAIDVIQVYLGPLWTSPWVGGSLAVVDPLLNFLNQQLDDLSDLKPACKQYVKKTMKTRMKSRQQQVAGSQRMVEDAKKIGSFFEEQDSRFSAASLGKCTHTDPQTGFIAPRSLRCFMVLCCFPVKPLLLRLLPALGLQTLNCSC
ncbi:hypothetical protein XENOCAPTIV_024725, partial [Xenoophorus captivus]